MGNKWGKRGRIEVQIREKNKSMVMGQATKYYEKGIERWNEVERVTRGRY